VNLNRRVRSIGVSFLIPFLAGSCAWSENDSVVTKTTLCELAQFPNQYTGKMVEVRANVSGSELWITDLKECPSFMGVILVMSYQVKPRPSFETMRDDMFNRVFEELGKGKWVVATFEGRFDGVYTWKNQKQIWISEGKEKFTGFGRNGLAGGRIILRRISDILALPLPAVD
jgi:hypothetical protein